MSRTRKRQFRFVTFIVLPVLLLLAAAAPALFFSQDDAAALSASEWETVRSAIDGYISGQYVAGDEGEAGFTVEAGALEARINSNGDATYLGEGDDAALAPVLVDNLVAQNNVIPATSVRCLWNGTVDTGCLEAVRAGAIRDKAIARATAGFSNDLVVYCLTAHTETPVVGGLGIISAAGGLGPDNPEVRGLKWGRNGWTNTPKTYLNVGALGSPSANATYSPASNNPNECDGQTGSELVRCTAAWAIRATGGSVGNGNTTYNAAQQTIDVRTGNLTGKAIPGSVQIPINTLFNTGLANLNPSNASKHQFVSRTQLGGIVAIGAEMLGYDSAFLQWGVPNYNNTLDEKQVTNIHPTYATIPATASDLNSGVDQTAPGITVGPSAGSITANSAVISRTANEPATMKVEYGTAPGVYTETVNNTILNAVKSVSLTGLSEYTTYYFKVTSYDGQANGTASSEGSFTTLDVTDPVITNVLPTGDIFTDTANLTAAFSDAGSGINTASAMVHLDGGAALAGCTVNATDISCPVSGLAVGAHTISVMVSDNATPTPNQATEPGSFTVVDNVAPTATHTGPIATVTSTSTNITGTWSDPAPSSGIASATVSLNGGTATACTIDGANLTCPVSGLATGTYNGVLSVSDVAGLTGTDNFVLDVNTDAPTITPGSETPPNLSWTADNTPVVSFDYTATGTITGATIEIDGQACAGAVYDQYSASCNAATLGDGEHAVDVSVSVGANTSLGSWSFKVDATAPTTTAAPLEWQNSFFDVFLTCDDGSGVGCDAASTQYRLNYNYCPDWQCEITVPGEGEAGSWTPGDTVTIDVEGIHTLDFYSADTLGNTEDPFKTETVGLDMTNPEITNGAPGGFTTDNTPAISADFADALSGIDSTTAVVTINGDGLAGCIASEAGVSCNIAEALNDGAYTMNVQVDDNAGNTGELEWTFNVDTTGPAITNVRPATTTGDTTPLIQANLADDAGVDTATVGVQLDGIVMDDCVVTATSVSCQATTELTYAEHTLHIMADDVLGNTGMVDTTFTVVPERTYYFPWYDNQSPGTSYDGIMITNEGENSAAVNVYVDDMNTPKLQVEIPVGDAQQWVSQTALMGGPVKVVSTNGEPLIVSQRVLYQGSFNEVLAVEDIDLVHDNYFTYYDNASPGMQGNWILITNTGETSASVNVYVADMDTPKVNLPIAAGGQAFWKSDVPLQDGPVRVVDASGDDNPLAVSQRVLYNNAFNEVMGVAANHLDDESYFTWYDNNVANGMYGNWIMATNMGSIATDINIYIGDTSGTPVATLTDVQPNETVNWISPTPVTNGLVRVASSNSQDLLTSQRVIYKSSFEEVQGLIPGDMVVDGGFNWYDNQPANGFLGDWLMIGNMHGTAKVVNISIDGTPRSYDGGPDINVPAYGSVTPIWPNLMAGPVEITCPACGADPLIMSQRVIYQNSFNEVVVKKYN